MNQSVVTTDIFGNITGIEPVSGISLSGMLFLVIVLPFTPAILLFGISIICLGLVLLLPIVIFVTPIAAVLAFFQLVISGIIWGTITSCIDYIFGTKSFEFLNTIHLSKT